MNHFSFYSSSFSSSSSNSSDPLFFYLVYIFICRHSHFSFSSPFLCFSPFLHFYSLLPSVLSPGHVFTIFLHFFVFSFHSFVFIYSVTICFLFFYFILPDRVFPVPSLLSSLSSIHLLSNKTYYFNFLHSKFLFSLSSLTSIFSVIFSSTAYSLSSYSSLSPFSFLLSYFNPFFLSFTLIFRLPSSTPQLPLFKSLSIHYSLT